MPKNVEIITLETFVPLHSAEAYCEQLCIDSNKEIKLALGVGFVLDMALISQSE